MRKEMVKYVLLNNGYNNKVYLNGKLVNEFTDTRVNAIEYVRRMNNDESK